MSESEKMAHIESNGTAHHTPRPSRIANPLPLGLMSFASTTFILSIYNCQAAHIMHPNVVVGMAVFCGGLAQLLAGMWEFPKGNTFGATAFTSYGVFWLSYATILIPGSGIIEAFKDESEFANAIGIYLVAWCMVTFFFCIVSIGKNIGFIVLLFFLGTTYACLAGGAFHANIMATKAGGVLGVITAFIAYYIAIAGLLEAEAHPPFRLPIGELHKD